MYTVCEGDPQDLLFQEAEEENADVLPDPVVVERKKEAGAAPKQMYSIKAGSRTIEVDAELVKMNVEICKTLSTVSTVVEAVYNAYLWQRRLDEMKEIARKGMIGLAVLSLAAIAIVKCKGI